MFCKSNVNKAVSLFLVWLKYRDITTVKTVKLYKKLYFFTKGLKIKEKKLALNQLEKRGSTIQKSLFA